MSDAWVDFRELRAKLRFADVLNRYKVQLKVKGDRGTGFCPLPCHPRPDGKRHSPSFSVNLARGIFQCFNGECGAKGNVLDFAVLMEGGNTGDSHKLREVALKLQEQFVGGTNGEQQPAPGNRVPARSKHVQAAESSGAPATRPAGEPRQVVVNAPLDFALKTIDVEHPYLQHKGLTPETISCFGLGYCARGLMADRIVIPLHDAGGKMIGYAGRLVDDAKITEENPKYRFPGGRERNGVVYEFKKSLFLYNGHRIAAPAKQLIIVEGFPSVWWLWQHGYHNVCAVMGSSCSAEQAELIIKLVGESGHVYVFPDADDAGERLARSLLPQLAPHRFVRWVRLGNGQQPTDCSAEQLSLLVPPPPPE